MRFLHTADWQIGKPFQSITEVSKREILRRQRLETIRHCKALIEEHELSFVVVCGDLFDSFTPDKSTVSSLCDAVGSLGIPVYSIPGNHDHGGPGNIWEQEFFQREKTELAPLWQILLTPQPLILENAVLLPCPLLRRHESVDPTSWLRTPPPDLPSDRPRIILAHGSTQGFSSSGESDGPSEINQIDLSQLPHDAFDYIALGDWHGTKEITPKAWFSGTPEQDRFARGENNKPGQALIVDCPGHGQTPSITPVPTGHIGWHEPDLHELHSGNDLASLKQTINRLLPAQTNQALLKCNLRGSLSFGDLAELDQYLSSLESRLLRLQVEKNLHPEPTPEELEALASRQDPLIARVASDLRSEWDTDPLARETLRELHLQISELEK